MKVLKNLQLQKINLEKEINGLRTMRNNYDGISPIVKITFV